MAADDPFAVLPAEEREMRRELRALSVGKGHGKQGKIDAVRLILADWLEQEDRPVEALLHRAGWEFTGGAAKMQTWHATPAILPVWDNLRGRELHLEGKCNSVWLLHAVPGEMMLFDVRSPGWEKPGLRFRWQAKWQVFHPYDVGAVLDGFAMLFDGTRGL